MTRTRFAPSPTGLLHVGAFRTALFSWLVARHDGGQFFLRLEDTDQERYVATSPRQIIESFQWLGLDLDGGPDHDALRRMKVDEDWPGAMENGEFRGIPGPFVQSHRLDIYKKHAEMLVASGHAYRANETSEELESLRKAADAENRMFVFTADSRLRTEIDPASRHVIRFKIDRRGQTVINDQILGDVVFENANLTSDPVILKSDGYATYHLAAMVDDHVQGVSHVIRAQEWLASAPLHVQIIRAFGWELPHFAHVPAVNGNDGKKLSKRTGAKSVFEFRDEGYLKEALLNFLAMLGWAIGDGDEQNVFTLDELIARFSLDRVGKSPAIFEYAKLDWLNEQHIKRLPDAELAERVLPFLEKQGVIVQGDRQRATLVQLMPLLKERMKKLTDAAAFIDFVFTDIPTPPAEMLIGPKMEQHLSLHALRETAKVLNALPAFDEASIETVLRVQCDVLSLKPAQLFSLLRNAVSGKTVTPPLFGMLGVLGRETVALRLNRAIAALGG